MAAYYFNRFQVNGEVYTEDTLVLQLNDNVEVTTLYDPATPEHLQTSLAGFQVYFSPINVDFFIINEALGDLVARLPTLEEAINWILDNTTAKSSSGILIVGALVLAYLRKK